jgi:hypothetical protein
MSLAFQRDVIVRESAARDALSGARRWLWLPDDALGPCVDRGHALRMGRASRQDWWLVPGTAIDPHCHVPPFGRDGN